MEEDAAPSRIDFTFIVFSPDTVEIGSPEDEEGNNAAEPRRRITLTRPLAVSDREVSWGQWNPIDEGTHQNAWRQHFKKPSGLEYPAFGINWFEVVNYCRWLNQQEGIPPGEQRYADRPLPADDDPGWVNLPDTESWPVNLAGHGFRLLTDAEWEVISRSRSGTAYSFGSDRSLLGQYGWFVENSDNWSHPVAELRPNPRGLFDVHGNLFEWCHDW